jgi:hypothetical protein
MAVMHRLAHGGRRHANAVLVVLDFFGHADAHGNPLLQLKRSWSQQTPRNNMPRTRSETLDVRNILRQDAESAHES